MVSYLYVIYIPDSKWCSKWCSFQYKRKNTWYLQNGNLWPFMLLIWIIILHSWTWYEMLFSKIIKTILCAPVKSIVYTLSFSYKIIPIWLLTLNYWQIYRHVNQFGWEKWFFRNYSYCFHKTETVLIHGTVFSD